MTDSLEEPKHTDDAAYYIHIWVSEDVNISFLDEKHLDKYEQDEYTLNYASASTVQLGANG